MDTTLQDSICGRTRLLQDFEIYYWAEQLGISEDRLRIGVLRALTTRPQGHQQPVPPEEKV
jgi:hypothetical protein